MGTNLKQLEICNKYNTIFFETPSDLKVGVSQNVNDRNLYPINGLRHLPHGNTSGWYIWASEEFSDDDNFFLPLHISHLLEWRPQITKYLGLPPGYRFLLGENDYEDVWYDESLLDI